MVFWVLSKINVIGLIAISIREAPWRPCGKELPLTILQSTQRRRERERLREREGERLREREGERRGGGGREGGGGGAGGEGGGGEGGGGVRERERSGEDIHTAHYPSNAA